MKYNFPKTSREADRYSRVGATYGLALEIAKEKSIPKEVYFFYEKLAERMGSINIFSFCVTLSPYELNRLVKRPY